MTPESIGGYTVQKKLGAGGMGVVYQGYDQRIGRAVAIKVIRLDPEASPDAGADLRHRLSSEARAAGQLSHPGIVTIYQLGEEGPAVFIVMELVQGQSLEQLLLGGAKLPPERIQRILLEIAEALDYAHQHGIVHRDVKPANILIREDGRVKVVDFGIAKILKDNSQTQTATGMSIGSPAYMSPEQVRGQPLDGQTDQFSLAVMAFQMVTGAMPFTGDSAHALMYQIATVDPPALRPENAGIDDRSKQAFARALAKDPSARFPDCASFVRALAIGARPSHGDTTAATVLVSTRPVTAPATALPTAAPAIPPPVPPPKKPGMLLPAIVLAALVFLLAGVYFIRSHRGVPTAAPAAPAAAATTEPPLLAAITAGKLDEAKSLIAHGANVNAAGPEGETPLMRAAEGPPYLNDVAAAIALLLANHAEVNLQDKSGATALQHAIASGKDDAALLLLQKGANVNLKNHNGESPLWTAIQYGRVPLVTKLLASGADVNAVNTQQVTPLMLASAGTPYMPDNAPLVQMLLAANANVDAQDADGQTALMRAVIENKLDAIRLLLARNANVNARTKQGQTPLMLGIIYGHQPAVDLLLDKGAQVDTANSNGETALLLAAAGNGYLTANGPMVADLIAHNANVEAKDSSGKTPLDRAAVENRLDAMKLLLDKKVDPNAKANDGATPLIDAVTFGRLEAATLLLERGADPNLAKADGTTPLMVVAEGNGYLKSPQPMIAVLLSHGAKTSAVDNNGKTALMRATDAKNSATMSLLTGK